MALGTVGPPVVDLRRDAWGHGLSFVVDVIQAAGIRRALVDDRAHLGDSDVAPCEGPATVDPARLFGLPGSDGSPVMCVVGRVLALKRLRAGEGVSYNHTHHATVDTRVALVSGGFGHGIPRALGNEATVGIGGRVHPIVGRVAMDVCVVDIGEATVAEGAEVVYFGGYPAADALAEWERITGWSPAELVCGVGLRAAREEVP